MADSEGGAKSLVENSLSRISGLSPLVQGNPTILLLGSLPGSRSLADGQYYAHPVNKFWRVMELLLETPLLELPISDRQRLLFRCGIALWDVVESSHRLKSLDATIREARLNDIAGLLMRYPSIVAIAFNGTAAWNLAAPWRGQVPISCIALPSTSGASRISVAHLAEAWACLQPYLQKQK